MYRSIIALVFTFASAGLACAQVLVVNSPGDGFLNLRTGPGSQYEIVTQMDHGTTVETLEIRGKWARVRHETGAVGWAFRRHMVAYDRGPGKMHVYSPGDGYLNLRTGPGKDFSVITRMHNGEWVQILERKGEWVRVFHEFGNEGWASSRYLRR